MYSVYHQVLRSTVGRQKVNIDLLEEYSRIVDVIEEMGTATGGSTSIS